MVELLRPSSGVSSLFLLLHKRKLPLQGNERYVGRRDSKRENRRKSLCWNETNVMREGGSSKEGKVKGNECNGKVM